MDIKDAINYFESYIEFGKKNKDMQSPTLEPYEIAVEAMKKQIARKPLHKNIFKGLGYKICPNCKERVAYSDGYYHKCGQRLDWSDSNG